MKFFEKDSIPKTKGKDWELRAKLGKLKTENPALNGGKNKAKYTRIKTDDDANILAFVRKKNGKKVVYIANFSSKPVNSKVAITGEFTNYMTGKSMSLKENEVITLQPFQYFILNN